MNAARLSCTAPPGAPGGRRIPTLETGRLVLRAPRLADAPAIAALADNRRIAEMTASIPHPYGVADAEAFVSALAGNPGRISFAVHARGEDRALVGACGYDLGDDAAPEIGYWMGEPFWGRGYATEAVRAMIDHAFTATGLDALAASCRVTNVASRRVLEKCGFEWTGTGLIRVRALRSSAPADRFRLDRRAWQSLRASFGRIFHGEPVPAPDQVRGRLSPENAPGRARLPAGAER